MRKEQGFTLIELLIVLAILGILVGVVAMSVGNLTAAAERRAVTSEHQIVLTAIDTYNTQDVAAEGADPIRERARAGADVVVALPELPDPYPGDAPFGQYLRRDTKYAYAWAAGGANLCVSVTGLGLDIQCTPDP